MGDWSLQDSAGRLSSKLEDEGVVPTVDYYQDYHLFVWSQIDGNDAREQLTAKYTVTRGGGGDGDATRSIRNSSQVDCLTARLCRSKNVSDF